MNRTTAIYILKKAGSEIRSKEKSNPRKYEKNIKKKKKADLEGRRESPWGYSHVEE